MNKLKRFLTWSIIISIIIAIVLLFAFVIIPNALKIFLTLKIIGMVFTGLCIIGYFIFLFAISKK